MSGLKARELMKAPGHTWESTRGLSNCCAGVCLPQQKPFSCRALHPLFSPLHESRGHVGYGVARGLGAWGRGGLLAHLLAPQLAVVRVVCVPCFGPQRCGNRIQR